MRMTLASLLYIILLFGIYLYFTRISSVWNITTLSKLKHGDLFRLSFYPETYMYVERPLPDIWGILPEGVSAFAFGRGDRVVIVGGGHIATFINLPPFTPVERTNGGNLPRHGFEIASAAKP